MGLVSADGDQPTYTDRLLGIECSVDLVSAEECAERLGDPDPFPADLVIGHRSEIDILEPVARSLTGSAKLAHRTFLTRDASVTIAGRRGDPSLSMAAVVRASVEALLAAGEVEAASSIHNALLRALEDRLTTKGLKTGCPYPLIVGDERFVLELTNRLGEEPTSLPRLDYRRTERRTDAHAAPFSVVHS